jgi:hypothetical protein
VSASAACAADKASIVYIEGDVTMNGSPASVGDAVLPGALLTTGADSLCQVVFNTKNIVHMAAGTTAPLLYHTDGDVEAIAARIGEKIDWTKIDQ